MAGLQAIRKNMERKLYGMTAKEARAQEICIVCKAKINDEANQDGGIWTGAGLREYQNSALCETCFNKATKEPEK